MPVTWLVPAAFAGLALLAVPLLVHLLVRARGRARPFPSLRFLRESRMASVAPRALSDWPLLLVRCLILASAVAAAAGPVWVGAGRRAEWSARVVRAVVITGGSGEALAREQTAGAFRAATIRRATVADGLRAAIYWLDAQPPAAREVVVVSPLVAGDLDAADVEALPAAVGVRFVRAPRDARAPAGIDVLREAGGRQVTVPVGLSLDAGETAATEGTPAPAPVPVVEVEAPGDRQAAAALTLAAVLAEGVRLPASGGRRVLVSWGGPSAPDGLDVRTGWMRAAVARLPGVSAREVDGRLVVGLPGAPGDLASARGLADLLDAAFAGDLSAPETEPIADAVLAGWTHPPGAVRPDAGPVDEGDRRWFWAAVLVLLGLEHAMRRSRDHAAAADVGSEAVNRVA